MSYSTSGKKRTRMMFQMRRRKRRLSLIHISEPTRPY